MVPAAMQTLEYVCCRAAIFVQGAKITLPVCAISHATLPLNGWNGIWPPALKLCTTCSTDERGSIATASKPVLLLPTRETRRPKSYFLNNRVWNDGRFGISSDSCCIRKLCVELFMSRAVYNALGTNALGQFLDREDRADVDVASLLAATLTLRVGRLDATRCDWVWMILEDW